MVYLRCMQVWRAEEVLVLLRITAALSWSHFRFLSMLRWLPSLFMCSIQVVALLILVLRCLKKRAWKQITKVYWRYANIVLAWTDLFMPLLHSLRTKLLLLWWHVRGITSPLVLRWLHSDGCGIFGYMSARVFNFSFFVFVYMGKNTNSCGTGTALVGAAATFMPLLSCAPQLRMPRQNP